MVSSYHRAGCPALCRAAGYADQVRARMAALAAVCFAGPAAAEPCVPEQRLAGIDVSSYQGVIDWRRVKAAGVMFAFARVSDGLEVIDQRFAENFTAMKQAGVRRGAYQFFRASLDPIAQADLLVTTVRRLGPADLPLVADVETADGMPPEEVRERLGRWLRRVERRTNHRPLVYTSPSMGELLGGGFGNHPLWVAHYGVDCPTIPEGWQAWNFWQYSSNGRVAGVNGPVDLDIFAGTLAQLRRLNRRIASPPSKSASGRPAGALRVAPRSHRQPWGVEVNDEPFPGGVVGSGSGSAGAPPAPPAPPWPAKPRSGLAESARTPPSRPPAPPA